jgi:hypothetical protein
MALGAVRQVHSRSPWVARRDHALVQRARESEMIGLIAGLRGLIPAFALFLILTLGAALFIERRSLDKCQDRNTELTAELKRISTAENEQKVITRDRIVIADKGRSEAEGRAKAIEAAPLPGNCKTPSEVLQADL